ncbi:D-alanyl-D-alanine-carboxypeptidase/endopeptidase AmpH [Methylobacterium nodulans]|uniref:Beta-lactamase n=1 Tax=Methylobacterium nodulans (strain LMG 21967 / CNCM I-2342 / ORS 2060) TaxID=460265 RepID=B8IES4_METNO|nr:D-alanyl-D-alanine-carboxypeptidase/endopeptidase AmpH [Methylobacterium nodulans]ACL61417.1 beta-lactamase [Methylobacterium nodulans ORS 2060]
MRFAFIALVFALVTATASHAADDPILLAATDLTGEIMFRESGAPGMVLVVVRGDQVLIRGYGETEKGKGNKPDGASLVRLNSITKVFTAEVLVSLASERKLALTDPLQIFAADARLPDFNARPITLLDLATHSAALPREMGDAPDGVNPRAWPTYDDRWTWLPSYRLPWEPGTIASYSNVGFDLLADAIGKAGGRSYPDLLRSHVTGQLGMTDTGFAPTPEQCARLMIGSGLGGPATCVDTHATDGSGGLYSTGNDMARWLRHNLDSANPVLALSQAVYRPRQSMPAAIGFDDAAPMAGLGLGWVAVAARGIEPMLLIKSGGGAGFMSYVAFAPGRDVGVFVVVNRVDFAMFSSLTDAANKLIANLVTR